MAKFIGVVRDGGKVVRVINPDFDWQLKIQVLSPSEQLICVPKKAFGISRKKDAMTLEQVHRVCEAYQ